MAGAKKNAIALYLAIASLFYID